MRDAFRIEYGNALLELNEDQEDGAIGGFHVMDLKDAKDAILDLEIDEVGGTDVMVNPSYEPILNETPDNAFFFDAATHAEIEKMEGTKYLKNVRTAFTSNFRRAPRKIRRLMAMAVSRGSLPMSAIFEKRETLTKIARS
jgi:hypothetical protein